MSLKRVLDKPIAGKKVRITYEGCDVLSVNKEPTASDLAHLLTASSYVYLVYNDQLFYGDKSTMTVAKLSLTVDQVAQFSARIKPTTEAKPLTQNQLDWVRDTLNHHAPGHKTIRDIAIQMTRSERNEALKRLPNPHVTTQNSSYTYLFQNGLAKYQSQVSQRLLSMPEGLEKQHFEAERKWMDGLQAISTEFIALERFINNPTHHENPGADPDTCLLNLGKTLTSCQKHIEIKIRAMQGDSALEAALIRKLQNRIAQFKTQLDDLRDIRASKEQIQQVLSIHDRSEQIASLGRLMVDQMTDILEFGLKGAYAFNPNRFVGLFDIPPSVAALSDAKKMLHIKGQTLDGVEYNDTYTPIPGDMLNALALDEVNDPEKTVYVSMQPYVKAWDTEDVDRAVCLALNKPLDQRVMAPWFNSGLIFLASVAEIAVFVPVRMVALAGLTVMDLTAAGGVTALNAASTFVTGRSIVPPYQSKTINRMQAGLSRLHREFSPIFLTKEWRDEKYRRTDDEGDAHQALLNECHECSNAYHAFFEYVTPERSSNYIQSLLASITSPFTRAYEDLQYLFFPQTDEQLIEKLQAYRQISRSLQAQNNQITPAEAAQDQVLTEALRQEELPALTVSYCKVNQIASPLEVFREIMIAFNDSVIDPLFRKSPGFATLFFMVSIATFGTYLVPSAAFGAFQGWVAWLQLPTNILSVMCTGKVAALGFQEQMIAVLLEWKFGVLTAEFLSAAYKGDFELLNDIFREPEKVTLALIGLVGSGIALSYLPLLPTTITVPNPMGGVIKVPNMYAQIMNFLIEESKTTREGGLPGMNGLELGFIGLKLCATLDSMASGKHKGEYADDLQQFAKECAAHELPKKIMQNQQLDDEVDAIVRQSSYPYSPDAIQLFKDRLRAAQQVAAHEYQAYQALSPEARADAQNRSVGCDPRAKLDQIVETVEQHTSPLEQAHDALKAVVSLASNEQTLFFEHLDPHAAAIQLYDRLDRLFDDYNYELQRSGNADLCIDKRDFLDVFYNKYCYKGSNNLLRSGLIFIPPLWALVSVGRGVKYLFATVMNKPAMIHQVRKSFSKDFVILIGGILAPLARIGNVLARSLTYTARFLVMAPVMIVFGLPALLIGQFNRLYRGMDWMVSHIAFHKPYFDPIDFLGLRVTYAQLAHEAGTIDSVEHVGERVLGQLDNRPQNTSVLENRKKLPKQVHNADDFQRLQRHDQALKKKTLPEQSVSRSAQKIAEEYKGFWSSSSRKIGEILEEEHPSSTKKPQV